MSLFDNYFKKLYQRTMEQAYGKAQSAIVDAMQNGGWILDCGCSHGHMYDQLSSAVDIARDNYYGVEWNTELVKKCNEKGIHATQHDLNQALPYADGMFRCVFALSVLEHLLFSCRFMRESARVLEKGGTFVLLTPNISTLFTIVQLMTGKMPSSGPHPDSLLLLENQNTIKVSNPDLVSDVESDRPEHRHLIIYSFRVLKTYLKLLGFTDIQGYGFGLYPFPNFMQAPLENIDPYHCHQMVFIAKK